MKKHRLFAEKRVFTMENVKISLAGDLGSGKSTVGKILCEKFGAQLYSTGTIQRAIAEEMGMTTLELNRYSETHPEIDEKIDNGLRALEHREDPLIIDSRMAWHFVPGSFSVYMAADAYVSAERIMNAGRSSEPFKNIKEAVCSVRNRRKSEMYRYAAFYGVNIKDMDNYDFVIDTSFASPERIAKEIEEHYLKFRAGEKYPRYLVCAERLLPCAPLSAEGVPSFVEKDGYFYLAGGYKEITERIKKGDMLIPCERIRSFGRGAGRKEKYIRENCNEILLKQWEKESGVQVKVRPSFLCDH